MNKIYQLDASLPSFGIFREDFYTPSCATISVASSYQNQPLYDLMKYQKKEGYYLFEDNYLVACTHFIPGKKSDCLVHIKPIFFAENEEATFYLDSKLENCDPANVAVSFRITYKASQQSYEGCLITPQCYMEVFKRLKTQKHFYELDLLPKLYEKVVKEITAESVLKIFENISSGEWNSDFLKPGS